MASKIKKQVWLPLILGVYMTGMAVYFLPKNHDMSLTMKIVTLVVGYAIVAALYFLLKKKDEMRHERENDMNGTGTLKVILLLIAATFCTKASAQYEEDTYYLNASVSGLNISYNSTDKLNAAVDISAGMFVADHIAVIGNIGNKINNDGYRRFDIGADARLYTNPGVFIGAGLGYENDKDKDWKGTMYNLHIGYACFLSRTVTIEPQFYYKHALNKSDVYDYGFKIGFGCYF